MRILAGILLLVFAGFAASLPATPSSNTSQIGPFLLVAFILSSAANKFLVLAGKRWRIVAGIALACYVLMLLAAVMLASDYRGAPVTYTWYCDLLGFVFIIGWPLFDVLVLVPGQEESPALENL